MVCKICFEVVIIFFGLFIVFFGILVMFVSREKKLRLGGSWIGKIGFFLGLWFLNFFWVTNFLKCKWKFICIYFKLFIYKINVEGL